MEQVEVDGLLWDKTITIINGKKHFTYDEAVIYAKGLGKRLPTNEEVLNLTKKGYSFDIIKDEKYIFFTADRKISIPFIGYINQNEGYIIKDDNMLIWLHNTNNSIQKETFYFYYEQIVYINLCNKNSEISILLVQDKPINGYCQPVDSIAYSTSEKDNSITTAISKEVDIASPLARQEGGSHYKGMAIEPVEYIHKNNMGFIEGNIIKYISHYKEKGGKEDLLKIKHFVDLLIEFEYPENE